MLDFERLVEFMPDVAVNVPSTGTAPMRSRSRTISATTYYEQYTIPQSERVVSGTWITNTFRIPARAVTGQPLLTISNGASSTKQLALIAVLVDIETIAAKTVINPLVHLAAATAITGGTTLGKLLLDASYGGATDANITLLQDASADGTNSTTALAHTIVANTNYSGRFVPRMHTLAGVSPSMGGPANLLHGVGDSTRALANVSPGNSVVVRSEAAAALVAADFHYEITVVAEEYTLP